MLRTTFTPDPPRYSRLAFRGALLTSTSRLHRTYPLKIALILFIVAIPFKAAMLFDIPRLQFGMVPVYAALLVLTLTVLFFRLDRRLPKFIWPKPILYLVGYGLLVGLSVLQAAQIPADFASMPQSRQPWSFGATQSAYALAAVVAAILLFEIFVAFPDLVWTAMRAHFAISLFVCFWGFYQMACFYRGWHYPTIFNNNYHYAQLYMETIGGMIRVSSTAVEPSWLAVYLVSVIPIAFYSVRHNLRILSPGLDKLVLVLSTLTLLLSTSITGFVGLILIALMLARRGELSKVLGIGLAIGILVLTVLLLSLFSKDIDAFVRASGVIQRFENISVGNDLSVSERGDSMAVAMKIFIRHPVLGVGEGNFLFYYNSYADQPSSYPIIFAMAPRLLADHGLVGAFLFGAFVVLTWRRRSPPSMPARARRLQESLCITFLATCLAILLTMPQATHYEFWLSGAAALALSTWVPGRTNTTGSASTAIPSFNHGQRPPARLGA